MSYQEVVQAERMMRAANCGTLNIPPLAPNTAPIPKNPGPLSDPQTDFFLNALGLHHIWTIPSNPILNSRDVIPEVEFSMDRNKSCDPNQLSISDDETDKSVCGKKENPADSNEINLDDDENDDVWEAASISADQISFKVSRTNSVHLPAFETVSQKKNFGVISFEDDVQIVPNKCDLTTVLNSTHHEEHSQAVFDQEYSS